jgi:hypothetical protein
MRTYADIKNHVIGLGYKWFQNPYSLNFIWERTGYNATNIFDDWLHICYMNERGEQIVTSIPATTKPGIKGSLDSPLTVDGVTGTAVIQSGQYLSAWQFRDTDKEFSSCPYFRQVGKINYWRDGNKDRFIDRVKAQLQKLYKTHWHRMSNNGTRGSGQVNNWSLGCMGAAHPDWITILPLVRRSVKMYGDKFTGTIVDSW